jgi:hypothetical protein
MYVTMWVSFALRSRIFCSRIHLSVVVSYWSRVGGSGSCLKVRVDYFTNWNSLLLKILVVLEFIKFLTPVSVGWAVVLLEG